MTFCSIVFIGSPASSPFDLKSAHRAAREVWAFTSVWKSGHEIDALTASLDPHTGCRKFVAVPRYSAKCQVRT